MSEVEELVLLVAAMSSGDAYGFSVKNSIQAKSARILSLATVHAALYRLEKKGYLRSRLGGATNERGGRRKRLFTITSSGLEALRSRLEGRTRMWGVVQRMHPLRGPA